MKFCFVLVCLLTFVSCSKEEKADSPKTAKIHVTDMMGREITLDEPATKIVAVNSSDCEIIYALLAGDSLVGRGAYCDFPEAALSVPVVESGKDLNVEQIMALNPEVVLMTTMEHSNEQIEALEKAGAKVVVSEPTSISGVYESIELIGNITGKNKEAKDLVSSMKQSFDDIKSKAKDRDKSIYFEVSPLEYGLWTAGKGTFMDEIASMLGLENIFSDVNDWAEISEEQVIERNPDYIVTITMYYGEGQKPEDEIINRKGWQNINAVKNKAVFNALNDQITRPGPRLVDAAKELDDFIKKQ